MFRGLAKSMLDRIFTGFHDEKRFPVPATRESYLYLLAATGDVNDNFCVVSAGIARAFREHADLADGHVYVLGAYPKTIREALVHWRHYEAVPARKEDLLRIVAEKFGGLPARPAYAHLPLSLANPPGSLAADLTREEYETLRNLIPPAPAPCESPVTPQCILKTIRQKHDLSR